MRSFPSASSSGSRALASLRSTARNSWSASGGSSRTPGCASPRWRDASTNWKASSPRPSSRPFSRTRRWTRGPQLPHPLTLFFCRTFWSQEHWERGRTLVNVLFFFLCRWMKATVMTQTCRSSACLVVILSIQKWRWGTWRDVTQRWSKCGELHTDQHWQERADFFVTSSNVSQQYESQTSFGSMYPTRIEGWEELLWFTNVLKRIHLNLLQLLFSPQSNQTFLWRVQPPKQNLLQEASGFVSRTFQRSKGQGKSTLKIFCVCLEPYIVSES